MKEKNPWQLCPLTFCVYVILYGTHWEAVHRERLCVRG